MVSLYPSRFFGLHNIYPPFWDVPPFLWVYHSHIPSLFLILPLQTSLFPILPLQTYWKHRANEVHVSQLLGFHPGLTWMRKPFEVSMLSVTAWVGSLFGKDWLTCHKSELICFMFKGHLQQCDIPVSDWHHWRTTCQSLHPGKFT